MDRSLIVWQPGE